MRTFFAKIFVYAQNHSFFLDMNKETFLQNVNGSCVNMCQYAAQFLQILKRSDCKLIPDAKIDENENKNKRSGCSEFTTKISNLKSINWLTIYNISNNRKEYNKLFGILLKLNSYIIRSIELSNQIFTVHREHFRNYIEQIF